MPLVWFALACVLPAAIVSFAVTAAMRKLAPRWGLIDHPAARKVHSAPTPLGGGVGIYLGFVVPLALAHLIAGVVSRQATSAVLPAEWTVHLPGLLERAGQLWCIIVAGTVLVTMGLLDDLKGLPWPPRLAVHLLLAAALAAQGVRATVFVAQPWLGYVVTVGWIIVLINAFNFLDNMDALSGGIGLIAAVLFSAVMLTSQATPRWLVGGCLLVLAGSLLGFLWHNRPPARIFMGDSGSTFVGMILACLTVVGTFYDPQQSGRHVMLAPLCVLAVPLYDFASVMLIRLKEGRSPFRADKCHFSHRLVELGLSRTYAVLTVHLATLTTGLGALLLYRLPDWYGASLVCLLILCVLTIIYILETVGRRRNGARPAAPHEPGGGEARDAAPTPSERL
jgi:UDP-GlcNAc:undecaprenyl-phosphate GlcNAc-1-phosphate transferase